MALSGSSDSIAEALRSMSDRGQTANGDEPGAGPERSVTGRQDSGRQTPVEDSAERGWASEGRGEEADLPAAQARRRHRAGEPDSRRPFAWLLMLIGAALLAPGLWAVGLLMGLGVPWADRPDARSMAWFMLTAWPIALCLFTVAALLVRAGGGDRAR